MTPAVKALDTAQVPYRLLAYDAVQGHDLGMAAADALALEPTEVFKTLVVELDGRALVVAVIPVASKLSLKKLARAANARSARLADARRAERATGYVTPEAYHQSARKSGWRPILPASARTSRRCTSVRVGGVWK